MPARAGHATRAGRALRFASVRSVTYNPHMVTINGKLLDPRHVELAEPVPPGENAIEVRLFRPPNGEGDEAGLLTCNPAFDFLRDEPDLYG